MTRLQCFHFSRKKKKKKQTGRHRMTTRPTININHKNQYLLEINAYSSNWVVLIGNYHNGGAFRKKGPY